MRGTLTAAGLAGLVLAGGCSAAGGGRGGSPPEAAELRIWVSPVVRWGAGAGRRVDVAGENATARTIALAEPDPAFARVTIFPGPDSLPVCGVEARVPPGPARRVELPPGGALSFRVDLGAACARVPAGEYRFEVEYRSPPVEGGKAFSGAFATRYGELVVEGPARGEREGSPSRAGRAPPRRAPPRVGE